MADLDSHVIKIIDVTDVKNIHDIPDNVSTENIRYLINLGFSDRDCVSPIEKIHVYEKLIDVVNEIYEPTKILLDSKIDYCSKEVLDKFNDVITDKFNNGFIKIDIPSVYFINNIHVLRILYNWHQLGILNIILTKFPIQSIYYRNPRKNYYDCVIFYLENNWLGAIEELTISSSKCFHLFFADIRILKWWIENNYEIEFGEVTLYHFMTESDRSTKCEDFEYVLEQMYNRDCNIFNKQVLSANGLTFFNYPHLVEKYIEFLARNSIDIKLNIIDLSHIFNYIYNNFYEKTDENSRFYKEIFSQHIQPVDIKDLFSSLITYDFSNKFLRGTLEMTNEPVPLYNSSRDTLYIDIVQFSKYIEIIDSYVESNIISLSKEKLENINIVPIDSSEPDFLTALRSVFLYFNSRGIILKKMMTRDLICDDIYDEVYN